MIKQTKIDEPVLAWPDIVALFKKYRRLLAVVFFTTIAAVWVALQVYFTDQYETKASLLVKIGRENSEIPATVQNGQLLSSGVRVADINSEVQMLSARSHVESVVKEFGPQAFRSVLTEPSSVWGYPKYYIRRTARWAKRTYKDVLIAINLKKRLTEEEEAILLVGNGTKVEPVRESDVLVLRVRLPSAKLAVDTANALLQHYLTDRFEVRKTNAGIEFFEAQLTERQAKLDELRTARAAVREQWGLSSPGEQRTNLLKELSELNDSVIQRRAEVERVARERETIAATLLKGPDLLPKEQVDAQNPSIQSIKERITTIELEKVKLENRYLADSEVIRKLANEIVELRSLLAQEAPTVVATTTQESNPFKRDLARDLDEHEIRLEGLRRELEMLNEPIVRIREELARLNEGSDAFETADREYRLAEQFYLLYAKRFQEARMSEDLDQQRIANVSIIAPPELPIEPIYPKKMFIMGIALPLALFLGIGLAALIESMEDRIASERDMVSAGEMEYLGTYRRGSKAKTLAS